LNQKYFRSFILIISTIIISGCGISPQVKSFNEFVVTSEGLYKKGEISPIEHYSSYYENVKTLQTPIPAQRPVLLKYGLTMLEHAEDLVDKKITRKEFDKLERRAVLVLETENSSVFAAEKKVKMQSIKESLNSLKNSLPKRTDCTAFGNHINCNSY
jgi:hypothetical protein